jgi:hexosaminidase
MYDVTLTGVRDVAGKPAVRMSTELTGCDIYYTFDGTTPDSFTAKYSGEPVAIPGDASVVKAIAWRGGRASGRVVTLAARDLTARLERQ